MVFSDLFFLFVFIPAFILCYLLGGIIDRTLLNKDVRRTHQARNVSLVIFSLIFYAWGEPIYVFLMLCCVLANYIIGLLIDHQERHRKAALVVGLIINIGILGVFKYANFFAETLQLTGLNISSPNIALPIGISFYTFQSISYLIDVYRKESPVQHRFIDLLLYKTMEWKLSSFFRSIGQKQRGQRLVMNWNRVVGSQGRAHFKPRSYKDRDGNDRHTASNVSSSDWVRRSF